MEATPGGGKRHDGQDYRPDEINRRAVVYQHLHTSQREGHLVILQVVDKTGTVQGNKSPRKLRP
jgi:hypothetical protein